MSCNRFVLCAILGVLAAVGGLDGRPRVVAADPSPPLKLTLRSRVPAPKEKNGFAVVTKGVLWEPKRTAVIVCDMWDSHHSHNAMQRVNELAPRMNEVLEKLRSQGVLVIHAPSSCMEPYKNHPGRKLAQSAPRATNLPPNIGQWCHKIPAEDKGAYPVDQSDGGSDSEPAGERAHAEKLKAAGRNPDAPWKAQTDIIKIQEGDAISDSGVEIWNLLAQREIPNVILVGVHTNMCVLGRPFGLRQLAKNGKNVVLMRDMTDTMYNPARWPYVSHFRGTELIVEHIEKFVCPTITSDQVAGGQPFRFKGDTR
jgi:nicotinamidase-related amidase